MDQYSSSCCSGLEPFLDPDFFKALCDPNRLSILVTLSGQCGEMTVNEISQRFSIDVSVVSRHLAKLRDTGILKAEKRGKQVFYSVRFDEVSKRLRQMADAIDSCCPSGQCKQTPPPPSKPKRKKK